MSQILQRLTATPASTTDAAYQPTADRPSWLAGQLRMEGSRAILLSEPPATCERLAPLTPPPGHQPQEGLIEMSKVSSGTGTEPWALWPGTWRQNMAAQGKKEAVEEPSTDMRKQGDGER